MNLMLVTDIGSFKLWTYYNSCEVHHVSKKQGIDAFMLAEKEYPLRVGTLEVMLSSKLRVQVNTEKVRELLQRIQDQNRRATEELRRKKLSVWKNSPSSMKKVDSKKLSDLHKNHKFREDCWE